MKNTIKKLLTVVLCICMLIVGSGNAYAQGSETIDEIADRLIITSIEEHDDYIIKSYKNISAFVSEVKDKFADYTDAEIGSFLIEYTGQGKAEDYDEPYLIEKASHSEINIQEEFMKAEEDGTTSVVSREEVSNAMINELIMPLASTMHPWNSDDGYMKLTTMYELAKKVGTKKYYTIVAKAEWLKAPTFRFKDVICIANTGVYDNTYNNYARYAQSLSCLGYDGAAHHTTKVYNEKYKDGTGSGVEILYPSVNDAGARVDLKVLSCPYTPNQSSGHSEKLNYMHALIRYRIICEEGKLYNIQGAYCHAKVGVGSIGVSISTGASISFSLVGFKSEYRGEPVTIYA